MTNLYHKREELKARGMTLISRRPESDEPAREYWGYTNRPNALLDHSATITHMGKNIWAISDFSRKSEYRLCDYSGEQIVLMLNLTPVETDRVLAQVLDKCTTVERDHMWGLEIDGITAYFGLGSEELCWNAYLSIAQDEFGVDLMNGRVHEDVDVVKEYPHLIAKFAPFIEALDLKEIIA